MDVACYVAGKICMVEVFGGKRWCRPCDLG